MRKATDFVARARRGARRGVRIAAVVLAVGAGALTLATLGALQPRSTTLEAVDGQAPALRILDRNGRPLYRDLGGFNASHTLALHEVPPVLQAAFLLAEDQRFYNHKGVDWRARGAAVWTNLTHGRAIRGASTISEQVVRMLHPRPRTVWSRWLEGFEATRLERRHTKPQIFEFYLNQVPYAANRRGIAQAADYYFDRTVDTLSHREMLALAIMVRAPSRFNLHRDPTRIDKRIERLSARIVEARVLTSAQRTALLREPFQLQVAHANAEVSHFVSYVAAHASPDAPASSVRTTLDLGLQARIHELLTTRVEALERRRVHHGAALVVDHRNNEVVAWAVSGVPDLRRPGSFIDAVTARRQPGSALKPFVYAQALEQGWTAATIIDDASLSEPVGRGVHRYRNYSRTHYGPVTVRQALGNSLNIPAVKTLNAVGVDNYLATLHTLGIASLDRNPRHYGDGLALGNGEMSLFELVQAYAVLARGGVYSPLVLTTDQSRPAPVVVFSPETTSLIANILSDAKAREWEFGAHSVLDLPIQTAIKTGTSSDYRDTWTLAFNSRYVVGVWMGNLDQEPTLGLTGSTGPALLVRSILTELMRHEDSAPLFFSPTLQQATVCVAGGQVYAVDSATQDGQCDLRNEWFAPGTAPHTEKQSDADTGIDLLQPVDGMHVAFDPRVPPDAQTLDFRLHGVRATDRIAWDIDGEPHEREGAVHPWPVTRGEHHVAATVWRDGQVLARVPPVTFLVK